MRTLFESRGRERLVVVSFVSAKDKEYTEAAHRSPAFMSSLDLFLPLLKVDLDRRLVSGVATAETPDRAGEIFDYASSKPYFEQWSAVARAASGGKSLGAVRAMHGSVAAGKLTDIAFDDEGKRIVIQAKIVDDDEWKKVVEGVYTGFSQGGRYVKRWADPETGLLRYTAEPHEISLVDLPCLPDATFEVIKDGVGEMRAFAARGLPSSGAASPRHLLPEGEGISEAERERDAATGAAMPDGASSSGSAKDDYRSGRKSDVEAHIVARPEAIRALGAPPDDPTKPFGQSDAPLGAPEALARAAETLVDAARKLERAAEENARLTKALDGISPLVSDLAERVAKLEAQPMPARAALRSLSKSADGEADAASADEAIRRLQALPPEARALALTKLSLANPLRY